MAQRPHFRDYLVLIAKPVVARLLLVDMLTGIAVFTCGTLFFLYLGARGLDRSMMALLFLITNGGSLLGAAIWAWLGNRLDKPMAAAIAFASFALLLVPIHLLPFAGIARTGPLLLLFGATLCASPVLIRSMLADTAEQNRIEDDLDQAGLLAALFLASNKLGMAIGPGVAFMLLARAGYQAGAAVQPPAAIAMLNACAIWMPMVIGLLCAALILRHRGGASTLWQSGLS